LIKYPQRVVFIYGETQQNYDFTTLLKPYEIQWVALSPDYTNVIASGLTLKEEHANVPQGEHKTVIFHKVLPFDALYNPAFR
jgi:hypothetical protein